MTNSKTRLLKESDVINKLYDGESMMLIKESVASGFVVLLGGTNKKKRTSEVSLAFMALTQGNVLDACFGVATPSRREETPASKASKEAKELLDRAATTDKFRKKAVSAYCEAFQVVVAYRKEYEKMNCFVKCFKAKKLQEKKEVELRKCFSTLAKAVAESR